MLYQVNDRLPPEIQVTKHQVRDFLGTLDEGSEEAEIDEVTAAVADIGSEETEIDEITAAMANINISSEDANPTVPSSSKQDNTPDSPSSPKPRDENFDMVVREFFRLYRNVERNYLLSLKRQFKRQVRTGPNRRVTRPPAFPVTHLRHHIEVLLTLRGVNPATVFRKAHDNDAVARVLTGVVLQCLAPMFEISKFESYGFRLHYIAESSSLGFGGRWVFADSESPRWPLVRDLLFKKTHHLPQPGPGPGPGPAPGAGEVPVRLAGVALGFPAEYSLAETRCVEFLDATEEAFLRREMKGKVCCVEALKFPFGDGSAYSLNYHPVPTSFVCIDLFLYPFGFSEAQM